MKCGILVIHITDLHHTPNDPDDHFDLACLYALDEIDLRAVVLDYSEDAFGTTIYEPGYVPVSQLNFLTGRTVPCTTGPTQTHCMRHPEDQLPDIPVQESAGIRLLIDALRQSPEPAWITSVGSCRVLAASFNRDPTLFREKARGIVLVAGSARNDGNIGCYNTKLDPHAMRRVWESGLPIRWVPCGGDVGIANYHAPHCGHLLAPYATLLKGLDDRLLNWFLHGLWGNLRGDIIRALYEANRYEIFHERTEKGTRNIFSLGGLILMAERELRQTPEGWRFTCKHQPTEDHRRMSMSWKPIDVRLAENGSLHWQTATSDTGMMIYERESGVEENTAMAEALNDLLRNMLL